MRTALTLSVILMIFQPVFGQTRVGSGQTGTGGTNTGTGFGGLSTGNFGSGFGSNAQTGTGSNQAASGQGAQSGVGSAGFGNGFSFDPGFGITPFSNPFGNTSGGMANSRMGMMGMGGLGMGMGMSMGMSGFGMGRSGMGGFGMGGFGMQQQQQQTKVRPTIRLGFDVARPSAQQRAQQAQFTLTRLPQAERFAGVAVSMEGSRAIVSGKLKDSKDAELLRQLLLLEPGVYQVDLAQLDSGSTDDQPSPSNDSVRSVPESAEVIPSRELVPPPSE